MRRWFFALLVALPAALLPDVYGHAQNDDYWVLTDNRVSGKSKSLKISKNVATHTSGTTKGTRKPLPYTDIATDHGFSDADTAKRVCETAITKIKFLV